MQGEQKNNIGTVIKTLAILTYIGGAILGLVCGSTFGIYNEFSMPVALVIWISDFCMGTLLYGFSEIINLLQGIKDNISSAFNGGSLISTDDPLILKANEEADQSSAKEVKAIEIIPTQKIAIYPYRPKSLSIPIVCPFCGMVQRPDVNECCECDAKFTFKETEAAES